MRSLVIALTMLAGLLSGTAPASAASISEVTGFGDNPGNLRMFRYVPDGLPAGRPVVVALHGCLAGGADYGTDAGWIELAQRWRFTVVLPQQQMINNPSRCFNWFYGADTRRGWGEAESIAQMTRRTVADVGGVRVYATGLSAGGAMTSAMLGSYPDLFAGGGIVAGVPYLCSTVLVTAGVCLLPGMNLTPGQWGDKVRSTGHPGPWPTVSVWHGPLDFTVSPGNLREIVDQWTNVHGIPATPSATDTVAGYPHAVYRSGSRTVVESYTITGMGHGQAVDPGGATGQCGHTGLFFPDANICAAWHIGRFWGLDR
ncbi:extracellular catalytic domain type 1 short-chain-length polyhydroxyalkanoate depolymerase [Actinokineospora sp.]|uniref:extracellular catalytic domain type 1 short-chain-length polyhydroxyalkanoate depolymerase n=1 Tax=Actinokineospora sp. TaxID=1872133 RepID=UPI004038093A